MRHLSNNKDLYEYLLFLCSLLKQRGATVLSETVEFASSQAATFPATEFLGESKNALEKVKSQEKDILTKEERSDLQDVLKQLDKALNYR